jgi:hypothetical protein
MTIVKISGAEYDVQPLSHAFMKEIWRLQALEDELQSKSQNASTEQERDQLSHLDLVLQDAIIRASLNLSVGLNKEQLDAIPTEDLGKLFSWVLHISKEVR